MILGAVKYMRAKRRRLKRQGIAVRSGLFSFQGGLGRITEQLTMTLDGSVRTNSGAASLRFTNGRIEVRTDGQTYSSDAVVLAVPPQPAGGILAEAAPGATETLDRIPMAPVALVHWASRQGPESFPSGFGFLVPRLYDLKVLGTIFVSQLFSGRAPGNKALFASFFGGMQDPNCAGLPDEELHGLVTREHQAILRTPFEEPEVLEVMRYRGAIPQLLPDHPERMTRLLHEVDAVPGLFLAGNYLTGVGIEHAVESGYRAAGGCLHFLRRSGGAS